MAADVHFCWLLTTLRFNNGVLFFPSLICIKRFFAAAAGSAAATVVDAVY